MEPSRGFLEDLDRFQNVLFAFFAEAFQVAQLAFARQLFHLFDRSGLECFPEMRDLLGPERLQLEQLENRFRIFFEELFAQGVVAGLEDFLDVVGKALADAGQIHELFAVRGEFFDGFRQAVEELRGPLVAAVAADHGAVDFQQLRRFPQDASDFAIFHM